MQFIYLIIIVKFIAFLNIAMQSTSALTILDPDKAFSWTHQTSIQRSNVSTEDDFNSLSTYKWRGLPRA